MVACAKTRPFVKAVTSAETQVGIAAADLLFCPPGFVTFALPGVRIDEAAVGLWGSSSAGSCVGKVRWCWQEKATAVAAAHVTGSDEYPSLSGP